MKPTLKGIFAGTIAGGIAFLGQTAIATTLFYSVRISGGKYEVFSVDPKTLEAPTTVSTITNITPAAGVSSGNPNGFAFDQANQTIFFQAQDSSNAWKLWGIQLGQSTAVELATIGGNLFTSGAFSGGTYYSVQQGQNKLSSLSINYAGGVLTSATRNTDITISGLPATLPNYGDIAVRGNTLFAMTTGGLFYSFDLANPANPIQTINAAVTCAPSSGPAVTCGPQIAFNSTGTTLYGIQAGTRNWYTIDTATGATTAIAFNYPGGFATADFQDIAGANPSAVPGPLPILGAAIAFRSTRKLRKRIKTTSAVSA